MKLGLVNTAKCKMSTKDKKKKKCNYSFYILNTVILLLKSQSEALRASSSSKVCNRGRKRGVKGNHWQKGGSSSRFGYGPKFSQLTTNIRNKWRVS
jgi:hypothetical protein